MSLRKEKTINGSSHQYEASEALDEFLSYAPFAPPPEDF
jgi:hypothetical protein